MDFQIYFEGDYGRKVKAMRIWKFSFYCTFFGLSFLLSFVPLKSHFAKTIAVFYNTASLLIFLYDVFIKSVKKDKYILALQQNAEKETKVSDLFKLQTNQARYDLTGNDETMLFKLVSAESGTAIAREYKNESVVLIPKKSMEQDELQFICKQINIYWTYHGELPTTVKCFKDKSIYKNVSEYVWELFPQVNFLFSPKAKEIARKTAVIVIIVVLAIVLMPFALADLFNCNILENIFQWLFE